jgi:hypothetical protein
MLLPLTGSQTKRILSGILAMVGFLAGCSSPELADRGHS